jgi:hypothetical protein
MNADNIKDDTEHPKQLGVGSELDRQLPLISSASIGVHRRLICP